MKYRAEIDGLRAIAVVPVILFHAGASVFSGGYVGVDVFFVISGFLITTILISDLREEKFSLAHFYERRARRILPALSFVILACIPFAYTLLDPPALRQFMQSIVATSTFLANVFFWLKTDYFDISAENNPLLHTWSLAVEEQFYVIFPIVLLLIYRIKPRLVPAVIGIFLILSLGYAQFYSFTDPKAAFYLLPTRAWELCFGALAAFVPQALVVRLSSERRNALTILGLSLILGSIFLFDKFTPTPSVWTAIPVFGATLVILFSGPKDYASYFLTAKPVVFIGIISYSAYLIHQPVFAFYRIGWGDISGAWFYLLIALVFGLAHLSWKFIETPFRHYSRVSNFYFSLIFLSLFVCFVVAGLVTHKSSLPKISAFQMKSGGLYDVDFQALKADANAMTSLLSTYIDGYSFETSKVRVLVVGDSLANDFLAASKLSDQLQLKYEFAHLDYDDLCFDPDYRSNLCSRYRGELVNNNSLVTDSDVIVLVVGFHPTTKLDRFVDENSAIIDKLVVLSSAEFQDPYAIASDFGDYSFSDYVGLGEFYARYKRQFTIDGNLNAQTLSAKLNVKFINGYDLFCKDDSFCPMVDLKGNIMHFDTAHKTRHGLINFSEKIVEHQSNIFMPN